MTRLLRSTGLRIGFVVVAVALAVAALVEEWDAVSAAMGRLAPWVWLASVPLVLTGLLASMQSWRVLLADMGSQLPLGAAARVYFVGQLGKYMPGSVWPLVAQMEMARDHGVPRARSAVAFAVNVLVAICVALLLACAALPLVPGSALGRLRWAAVLAPVFLAVLHPAILNRLVRVALRLIRRPATEATITGSGALRSAAWVVVAFASFGAQIWVVASSFGAADPLRALVLSVGGYALAWSVGFLFVIAPAGVGVRDVALVAALSPVLDRGEAIVAALVSRVLFTAGDLATAGAAAAGYRGRRTSLAALAADEEDRSGNEPRHGVL